MSTAGTSRSLPRSLHLVSNTAGTAALPTPSATSVHAPLSAPLSRERDEVKDVDATTSRPGPRRQSSISYNTGSSKARSSASGVGRRNSLGSKAVLGGSGGENSQGDENGPLSQRVSLSPDVRETEPITLAEKHADLLRFIAQKESKCLELRTQLAQHEADLLLLKRKWERIVSKGLPSSARIEVQANVGSDMLDGIREGVQSGLGKVFAVLEPTMIGSPSTSQLPLSASQLKPKRLSQHLAKESSPSSSKRASISTVSSTSTRDRSSLSGSRSSSSSLFDELPSPDHQALALSMEGEKTGCRDAENDEACRTAKRNSLSIVQCLDEMNTESLNPEDDASLKKRRSGLSSMNLSHLPSPFPSSVTSEGLAPLSRQMANWVPPGLNKKWEELKGSETLSKQSKRASVLLNDVLAVLAPPIPPSPKAPSATISKTIGNEIQAPSQHTLGSAFLDSTHAEAGSTAVLPRPFPSLLDEKDECDIGEVMQPQVKAPGVPKDTAQKDGEEEWNW